MFLYHNTHTPHGPLPGFPRQQHFPKQTNNNSENNREQAVDATPAHTKLPVQNSTNAPKPKTMAISHQTQIFIEN